MRTKLLAIYIISIMVICVSCGKDKQKDMNMVTQKIEMTEMKAICELATMECYYHNVGKYDKKDVEGILLWKKDKNFWIEYTGVATIGVDVSKMKMDVSGNKVTIALPKAEILNTKVDESGIKYYKCEDCAQITADDEKEVYKDTLEKMREEVTKDESLIQSGYDRAKTLLEEYVKNVGEATGKTYEIVWEEV